MPYKPFDTPIGEALHANDLQRLITRSVSEGYYIKYKGHCTKND